MTSTAEGLAPVPQTDPAWAEISASLEVDQGTWCGRFGELSIGSAFQPIFSLAHRRAIGFEALMRATDGRGSFHAPIDVLAGIRGRRDAIVHLDRLCRMVHLRNYARHEVGRAWVFLNVTPQVIAGGGPAETDFGEVLADAGIAPDQVVIEILETGFMDDRHLAEAVMRYRELGCLIALDDFGVGHSNFDRIARLRPDIVKLDRSIVLQAAADESMRSLVPGIVSLLHEAGALVVMEGIETGREAMIAMDADADFVQGRYFAPPAPWPRAGEIEPPALASLHARFGDFVAEGQARYRLHVAPYFVELLSAAEQLADGAPPPAATEGFLQLSGAFRCFLLSEAGEQIGPRIDGPHARAVTDARFAPLHDTEGANWSRRRYFRRAIASPGRVQVTRPYLSVISATPCITVATAFPTSGGSLRVLCGEIQWDERNGPWVF